MSITKTQFSDQFLIKKTSAATAMTSDNGLPGASSAMKLQANWYMSSHLPHKIPSHPIQTLFISSYMVSEKYGQRGVFISLFIISRPIKSPNNSKLHLIVAVCQITPISFFRE
jgi:hypothetical protein